MPLILVTTVKIIWLYMKKRNRLRCLKWNNKHSISFLTAPDVIIFLKSVLERYRTGKRVFVKSLISRNQIKTAKSKGLERERLVITPLIGVRNKGIHAVPVSKIAPNIFSHNIVINRKMLTKIRMTAWGGRECKGVSINVRREVGWRGLCDQ